MIDAPLQDDDCAIVAEWGKPPDAWDVCLVDWVGDFGILLKPIRSGRVCNAEMYRHGSVFSFGTLAEVRRHRRKCIRMYHDLRKRVAVIEAGLSDDQKTDALIAETSAYFDKCYRYQDEFCRTQACREPMSAAQRSPTWGFLPGYWKHESTGVLAPAVHAYLGGDALTPEQITILRAYFRQWIAGLGFWGPDVERLRRDVDALTSRTAIEAWIDLAEQAGCDPL
jgi:hypothetical protein